MFIPATTFPTTILKSDPKPLKPTTKPAPTVKPPNPTTFNPNPNPTKPVFPTPPKDKPPQPWDPSTDATDIPPMPTLEIPEFKMPEEASTQYQLDRITDHDSLLMQRAETTGNNLAHAMGQSRGSLAAGHAMNSVIDKATPIAIEDAGTAETGALTHWKGQFDESIGIYNKQYEERLNALGYDQKRIDSMILSNTNLTTSLMAVASSLLNNTDLSNSESLVNWIISDIIKPAQQSNDGFVGGIYNF